VSDYLSVPQAAERIGISPGTMRRLIAAGEIAVAPLGCGTIRPRYKLRPEWVDDFIRRRIRPAKDTPPPRVLAKRGRPPEPQRERVRASSPADDMDDLARSLLL
jgi:excisionase family DNA binding protein